MAYQRKTTRSGNIRSTTTFNDRTNKLTQSTSMNNTGVRQTFSNSNGKVKVIETRNYGNGWIERTQRTVNGTVKSVKGPYVRKGRGYGYSSRKYRGNEDGGVASLIFIVSVVLIGLIIFAISGS